MAETNTNEKVEVEQQESKPQETITFTKEQFDAFMKAQADAYKEALSQFYQQPKVAEVKEEIVTPKEDTIDELILDF